MTEPSRRAAPGPDLASGIALASLWLGAGLAGYLGLEHLGLVPSLPFVGWSHVHVVTIGGFIVLLAARLPVFAARETGRPPPPAWYTPMVAVWGAVGLAVIWWGRTRAAVAVYEIGVVLLWLLAAVVLLAVLDRVLGAAPAARHAGVWLAVLSPIALLLGVTYAWGLYGHAWNVSGGPLGLREAHIHANGWGFLGLGVITAMHSVLPGLVGVPVRSRRLRRWAAVLLGLGLGPLAVGPLFGLDRTLTAPGLLLYAAGYGCYVVNLLLTARAGPSAGAARFLIWAQLWVLAPIVFAPAVFFGIGGIGTAGLERAALHFLFVGWALPSVLVGLLTVRSDPGDAFLRWRWARDPVVGDVRLAGGWHGGVALLGLGILAGGPVASVAFGVGALVVTGLWVALLAVETTRWVGTRPDPTVA